MGGTTRQILSGIAADYQPEDLLNRLVVVVTNLKPRKIRGLVSEGMLLCAESENECRLLTVDGTMSLAHKFADNHAHKETDKQPGDSVDGK